MLDLQFIRNRVINTNEHILFIKNPKFDPNAEITQSNNYNFIGPQSLNLFGTKYQIDIYGLIPRLFTITTRNNHSHKFNISLLKETSEVIAEFLVRNPDKLEFNLDIDDNLDVLGKFEQMYLGQKVIFEEKELQTAIEITRRLNIINCPNYLKSREHYSKYDLNSGVGYYLINSSIFFTIEGRRTFKIITNKKQYDCNIFAVYSSKVIRDFLSQNPNADQFEYKIEDSFDEFQLICDLFNFRNVPITVNNMDSLKEIIDDLQITYFTDMIDIYVKDYEKVSRTIDDQQTIIDSIEGLFELLYNIKDHTVEKVKEFIVDSFWSKTDENVQELAAFILQVIRADFKYHPYLIELLIQLDKESNETNNLNILIPFMVKKLLFLFGENNLNCSFVYNLYQKGVISKSEIIESLTKILSDNRIKFNNNNNNSLSGINHENFITMLTEDNSHINLLSLYSWFLAEIVEINKYEEEIVFKKGPSFGAFIGQYYPDKLEDYKIMRDKGEPSDPLTLALRNDDIDTLQSILSKNGFHISENDSAKSSKHSYKRSQQDASQFTVPFNIFEEFILNGQTKYIDYAAAYGSIKCFKYLLLNHCEINETTFKFAVYGGNIEIIKIVDHKTSKNVKNSMIFSLFLNQEMNDRDFPSIMKHQNDLFDWILQEKYLKSDQNNDLKESLLRSCARNGNAHALIEIIDKGNDYMSYSRSIIETASKNGFYRFTNLFVNILPQKNEKVPFFKELVYLSMPFVWFGNLSLFKLYCKSMKIKKEFERALELSIARDYSNISEYCFDLFKRENMTISMTSVFNCLNTSISKKNSIEAFNYLIDQFKLNDPTVFKCFKKFNQLLSKSCALNNLEITKKITDLILENKLRETFTKPFYNAAISGSFEICQFFVDRKVFINYGKLAAQILKLSTIDEKIFDLIVKNADQESKKIFLSCYIGTSIEMGNKNLTEYLFKDRNVRPEDELFKAVYNRNLELVDIILKNNKDPSLINKKYKNGTALAMAVKNDDLPMVKRLLSVPGINPSLYGDENKTPLLISISKLNLEILNEILAFYGENIQSQKWQIDKALKMALKLISTKSKSGSNLNYLWGGSKSSSSTSNLNWGKNKAENYISKKASILSIVKRLLQIDSIDYNIHAGNYTILSYACEMNEIEIVQMLLNSNKVNVNLYSPSSGNTPLITAIEFKNVEIAKYLIEYPKTNINMRNYQDHTALTTAVDKNLYEIIDLLINNEKFDADEINLNYAFFISTGEASKILIKAKNLDVNYKITLEISSYINNSINSSQLNRKSKSKLANKDYAELNEDNSFRTPLIDAINLNNIEKLELIIHHPSFDKDKSLLRKSLFVSVLNKNFEIFNILIALIDDVNMCDVDSESLLKFAVKNGTKEMIPIILNNKSFDSDKSDILSAFYDAFEWPSDESIDIMEILCSFDKDHDKLIDFGSLLPNGKTFFTSIGYSYDQLEFTYGISPNLTKVAEIVQFLLDHGADPNMPDRNGFYPLEYAIILDSIEFVRVLLNSNKVEISKMIPTKIEYFYFLAQQYEDALGESDAKLKSYLHLAARSSNAKILEEFLQRKLIDINIVDDMGETPLMDACRYNRVNNILLLFKCDDLDYLHKNNEGEDAIQICQNILNVSKKCKIRNKKEYLNHLISFLRIEEEEEDFEEEINLDFYRDQYHHDEDFNEDIEVD